MKESIYDYEPLLELDWDRYKHHSVTKKSANWYLEQLKNIEGPICELGCGYGRLLLPLAKVGKSVIGIDSSQERVTQANKLFKEQDCKNYLFKTGSVPLVSLPQDLSVVMLSNNFIGYMVTDKQLSKLFESTYKALSKNGLLMIDFRLGSSLLKLIKRYPGVKGNFFNKKITSKLRWNNELDCIEERFMYSDSIGNDKLFIDYFRFPTVSVLKQLLLHHGFKDIKAHHGFSQYSLLPWSKYCSISARK